MITGPSAKQLVKIMKEPADSAIDLLFKKLFPEHYKELQERREKDKQAAKALEEKIKKEESQETVSNGSESQTQQEQSSETEREKYCRERVGNDGVGAAVSPALMYWATTTFNDFMFPSVLPYGILQRDKCHIINVLNPFFILIGPATLFVLDNFTDRFGCWTWYFDLFWLLFIPLPIIFTLAMKAIFTRSPSARRIINSQPRVACMTLAAMFSFGCNEPLSYMGLGKYAFRQNPGGFTLLGYHISSALFCRYISSKIAVGFSDTRLSLGYHLPKFRPNHRMSKRNLGWYIFRQTFKRTWQDAKGDIKLDIKKYL
ncbi:hypothetical protein MACJ_002380 [Theileria orientalis]|uniref:Uncharacterized protein n=1 Tax=Theileria orientalis TaxID=68886 RepID=A0A976M5Z1_THEOR|nr:hypothetical protein MACJ_002380 [Theileria orientalis]